MFSFFKIYVTEKIKLKAYEAAVPIGAPMMPNAGDSISISVSANFKIVPDRIDVKGIFMYPNPSSVVFMIVRYDIKTIPGTRQIKSGAAKIALEFSNTKDSMLVGANRNTIEIGKTK